MKTAIQRKKKYNGLIVSNLPYSDVDFFFNTKEEFFEFISLLSDYFDQTNNVERMKLKFKPILIILDETQLYFFSRDFAGNFKKDN